MVQMMTIHRGETWNNIRLHYLSNQIHLQMHPQDKHSTDNKGKMTRLILHNTVGRESARLPASCMGGRAESRSRGGAGLVWRGVTEKNSTFPRRCSRCYTLSNSLILWLFNWLPLATFWQRKHWLSAAINHSLFVFRDVGIKSCTQQLSMFDLNRSITPQMCLCSALLRLGGILFLLVIFFFFRFTNPNQK